jgi:hypothetical protein
MIPLYSNGVLEMNLANEQKIDFENINTIHTITVKYS